jgi:hypothetical protein
MQVRVWSQGSCVVDTSGAHDFVCGTLAAYTGKDCLLSIWMARISIAKDPYSYHTYRENHAGLVTCRAVGATVAIEAQVGREYPWTFDG